MYFLHILGNNIIPVFTIIGLGYVLGKKFNMNMFTISKLNFYLFVPGFVFYNLYTTELYFDMIKILIFSVVYLIINDLLSRSIAKVRNYDVGLTNAMKNSLMFNNSGNIGVSLITLVFSSAPFIINGETPYLNQALPAQIMILVFMNITMNTIGLYNAGRANMNIKESIKKILDMPAIYVVILALLFRYFQIDITKTPVWPSIVYIKGGLVPMALLSLGIQLAKTNFNFRNMDVHLAVFTRLVFGPVLALILIYLFGFYGIIAQTIFISYSVPTAVNTVLLAIECDNNQDFAAQVVMLSTIFSAVTLTFAIYAARILFPI